MEINNQSITNYFENIINIAVYNNGGKSLYFKGDDKFEKLLSSLKITTNNAHDMPAYGVSLNDEVVSAKESGLWIELIFECEQVFNEMPFDCLLIEVNKDNTGFNLHRKYNGKYEGRCFYLKLNGDMTPLFDAIIDLIKLNK